jgi:hypothetical protein
MKLRIKYRYTAMSSSESFPIVRRGASPAEISQSRSRIPVDRNFVFAIVSISVTGGRYETWLLKGATYSDSELRELADQAGHELTNSGEFELALSAAEVHA